MQALPESSITDAGRQWRLYTTVMNRRANLLPARKPYVPVVTSDPSRHTYNTQAGLTHPMADVTRESRARMTENRRNRMAQSHTICPAVDAIRRAKDVKHSP